MAHATLMDERGQLRHKLLVAAFGAKRPIEIARKCDHCGRGILKRHARPPIHCGASPVTASATCRESVARARPRGELPMTRWRKLSDAIPGFQSVPPPLCRVTAPVTCTAKPSRQSGLALRL